MKTEQDRLEWAVTFAQQPLDLDAIRKDPRVLKAIRKDLDAFCRMEAGPLLPMPDTDPLAITHEDLRGLQGAVAAVLALSIEDDEGGLVPSITVEKVFLHQQRKTKRGQRPALMMGVTGSVRDVVLELLYQTLLTVQPGRIRRCPGCRKLFVRTGRQTHCSSACYDRDYWAKLPTKTVERYRKRQYEPMGWKRGASLQRIATKSRTGGKKRR